MFYVKYLRPKSLFARFFLTFLFTLTISTMTIIVLMPRQLEGLLIAHAERDMVNKIARVRPSAERFLSGVYRFPEIQIILATTEDLMGGGLYIIDQHGTIRASSPTYGSELLARRVPEDDLAILQGGQQFTRRENDARTLTIAVPIIQEILSISHGRQSIFFGALYLQVPLEALRTTALITGQQLSVMPLVVCITALIMGGLISRSLSRPLQRLSLATLHMAQGDYSTRVNERRDDELGQLGQSFNMMAVSLDMSIRNLRDERDRIRNLIHALTEGVIATDSNLRILLLNPAAAQYLSLHLESALGCSLDELPLPDELTELLTGSSTIPQSSVISFSDQLVLEVTTSPLSDSYGNFTAQIAILKDITEAWRLEEQRKEFVANVSHELRTPLTSIRGFVEGMLDSTIPPEMNDRYLNIGSMTVERVTLLLFWVGEIMIITSAVVVGYIVYLFTTYTKWTTRTEGWRTGEEVQNLPLGIACGILVFVCGTLLVRLSCEIIHIVLRYLKRDQEK